MAETPFLQTPTGWTCTGWIDWNYANLDDPAKDLVVFQLTYREHTGHNVPDVFYSAYGSRADEIRTLVYENARQLWVAPNYARETPRYARVKPSYSTAIECMDALGDTAQRLKDLIST